MLDRHDAPRGKAAAIPNAVDLVDNWNLGISGQQEIGMKRMRWPLRDPVDRTAGGNQRLADHLAAEHALPADLRRAASKQIYLDRLKIKDGEQILYRRAHNGPNKLLCERRRVLVTLETKSKSRYVTVQPGVMPRESGASSNPSDASAACASQASWLLDRPLPGSSWISQAAERADELAST